mgnify:FL=1
MSKKLIFIGKGNAGCFGALHFSTYTNCEIELIYDPNVPEEKVGQATVLEAPDLLWRGIGMDWYHNSIKATPKLGILYENWGKKKEPFFHPFSFNNTAVHYAPKKLQEAVLKCGRFKVRKDSVKNPDDLDADFIFDCRGKLHNQPHEYERLTNPLNAVILGQGNSRDPKQMWTRAVATPDGWAFVIPNTTDTTSYGYMYNHTITSTKQAMKNFNKLFSLAKQGVYLNEKADNFKFQNYIAKDPIKDRVILSGNRFFFLEPLESTAVQAYLQWYRLCYDHIFNQTPKKEIIKKFKQYVYQVEQFILWHYLSGSKYDTPFWRYCSENYKITDPHFNMLLAFAKSQSYFDLRNKDWLGYGQFHPISFKYWADYVGSNKK